MIFISADHHFGHANISRLVGRPFDCIEDMDAALIANTNRVVGEDDTLYHLGDFAYRNKRPVREYRDAINCRTIHLIRGNHDPHTKQGEPKPVLFDMFETVRDMYTLKVGGLTVIMCHYPMRTWNGYCRGTYHAHGHVHGRTYAGQHGLSADVGVDAAAAYLGGGAQAYRPVSLEEFVDMVDRRQ